VGQKRGEKKSLEKPRGLSDPKGRVTLSSKDLGRCAKKLSILRITFIFTGESRRGRKRGKLVIDRRGNSLNDP